ncbi:CBS domain-containing protein [Magnetofaba australis]|uniref:Putative signal transduction protein n=1 Tax=Magnetofaba australis IT-1 TaxID=1434232 RepID=A0A1Y2K8G8_9PROT|nr:CBS domain-containing protein [Magnetofaba australis]OSM07038.1 putative signal transduction protein [Magnetofaba australis IT-1]
MSTVKQILSSKMSNQLAVIAPTASVFDALVIMSERNIGALLVLEEGQLIGTFSERDYARKGILQGRASKETPVRDMMSAEIACVSPDASVQECMALMTHKRFRHLPVLDEGKLVGVISIGDVVHRLIGDQAFTIQHLEEYITGNTLAV